MIAGKCCHLCPGLPVLPTLPCLLQRVGDLERRRAAAVQQTLGTFVHIYRSAVVPIQEIAGGFEGIQPANALPGGAHWLPVSMSLHAGFATCDHPLNSSCLMPLLLLLFRAVALPPIHPRMHTSNQPPNTAAVVGCPPPAATARSCPALADQLQELLGQIDAHADLESFTETAASSVRRWAAGRLPPPYCRPCCCPHDSDAVGLCVCPAAHACSCRASLATSPRLLPCPVPGWRCVLACSAEALSARQREAVDQICGEVLGSAEIVR